MKFSSRCEACSLSPIRKFHPYVVAAEAAGRRVLHLNIGQPDVETPKAFFDAVRGFSDSVLAYAPAAGVDVYLEAVRDYYQGFGVSLALEDILATYGGSEALQLAAACILDDGDEVLVPEPFYPNYDTFIGVTGGKIVPIPTSSEEGYRYARREKIEPLIGGHTKAIMITNPGNPTGAVLTPDELKLMLDIAKENDLCIVCDEVYREFVYGGEPLMSALQFEGYEDNVIVIDSVSKRFSACGSRTGMLISKNKAFMSQAMKWCQCRLCSPTVDQVASAALYTLPADYFAEARAEYKLRRDTLMAKIREIPGVICAEPKGAFYVMAALPVDDADTFQHWLLNEFNDNGETVMFACGEPFYGTPNKGKNEVRMAYVLKQEDLERAMDILKIAIEKYNNR